MTGSASEPLPMLGQDHGSWSWLDVAPDAMLVVNRAGQIVRMNGQAERLFGYTRLELGGQPLETLLPAGARAVHQQHRQEYFAHPEPRPLRPDARYRARHKDGHEFPVEISLSPLQMADEIVVLSAIRDLTERKRTEGALRASEERFSKIFFADPTAKIISTLADGRILEANDRAFRLFQYQREEVLGKTVAELGVWVHPEHRAQMVQQLRAGEAVRDLEIQVRLRSGEQRIGLLSAESIEWGNELCLLSMLEDITERRTAERALWQAKELLETMFSAIDLCVAYLDREFNFIRVNRAYAAADGREPEFFVGKNHFALYSNAENEALFRRVIATGEAYAAYAKPFESANHPERGPSYWDWSLQPTKDEQGETTGVVLSLVNVTERIKAQEALRTAAERLHFVVHNAPIALWAMNREGSYTLLEGTLIASLGWDPDESIGQSAMDRPCYDPDFRQHLTRAFQGEEFGADCEWQGKYFHTQFSPIRDGAGQVMGVMGVATDITERRHAEERSQELAREMVHLQEEDRRQVTHALYEDAGQVLAAVKMQLESLGCMAPGGTNLFREQAGQAAQRLGDVISGLRLFADELRPPALDAAGLPLALKGLCERIAAHAGLMIEYTTAGCDDLPTTEAISMYRFVQEALTNTARCARANSVRVHLGREAGAIIATVEDDGPGFDPHDISALREKRGESLVALQEKFKLLGGHLEIISHSGQGTELIAHLPLP